MIMGEARTKVLGQVCAQQGLGEPTGPMGETREFYSEKPLALKGQALPCFGGLWKIREAGRPSRVLFGSAKGPPRVL